MTDAEYDLMLDLVADAIEWSPQDNAGTASSAVMPLRRAANDNHKEWKPVPFPAGWHASC